ASAHHMDVEGHHISGLDNQIVWGLPHVFAIFLIVAASGSLNLASFSSVFSKEEYKPLARLSSLISIALLVGGLMILLLDLGRPDRLIVAMTYYNFKSIFAWNIILYTGFIAIVTVYLWMMMERRMARFIAPVGIIALVWRLVLTTGTGSIFGFLVAREAYDSALLAPMFIVMSFSFGLAVFLLLLIAAFRLDRRVLDFSHLKRLRRLLGLFTLAVFYFVLVFHITKLYGAGNHSFENFILLEGGSYSSIFWIGQILIGTALPLLLLFHPGFSQSVGALIAASIAIICGALSQLYVIIIGGQAFPLNIFPGYQVESSFFDGAVSHYSASVWEILLGLSGVSVAVLLVLLILRVLPIAPDLLPADASDEQSAP
ncbi:MAG: NrfD/PsrC family molybdoenzyme membrane anchor subunit, partial [Pseudomonadota bacterium]